MTKLINIVDEWLQNLKNQRLIFVHEWRRTQNILNIYNIKFI